MKKLLLTAFLIVFTSSLFAQVGIGTDVPNPSSLLDITADDKGVLLTRVQLTGTTDNTTITPGNVESLLVYNTATTGDVTPGYYYWHNGQWNRVLTPGDIPVLVAANETLTTFNQDVTSGQITYKDEAGNNQTAEVVSTDTDNLIKVGADGGAILKAEDIILATNATKTVSVDYTAALTDAILLVDATSGNVAITLPAATAYKGKKYTIRKQNTGENHYVQVNGNIAGIPASENLYTAVPYTGWTLVSDGNRWYIINKF